VRLIEDDNVVKTLSRQDFLNSHRWDTILEANTKPTVRTVL
jgi:hypothetical protein